MSAADATLIIPQFNRSGLTIDCVRSFRRFHGEAAAILIVDDGSDPAELAALQAAKLPATDILRRPHRGLTVAWNAGAALARTRFLVFLNNDVVSHGAWLPRLLSPLERGTAFATGAADRIERRVPAHRLLAGWCLALPLGVWRRLGGFDPALRLYFSDTDLQLRLIETFGGPGVLQAVPALPLTHAGHATARMQPDRRAQWRTDRDSFLRRWPPRDAG